MSLGQGSRSGQVPSAGTVLLQFDRHSTAVTTKKAEPKQSSLCVQASGPCASRALGDPEELGQEEAEEQG